MKLSPMHLVFAVAVGVAPAAPVMAGQQDAAMGWDGQKARPIPVTPSKVPPQNVPVMIAEANQAQAAQSTRMLGVCHPAPNNLYSLDNVIEPIYMSRAYFDVYEHKNVTAPGAITILQQPKHGLLRLVTEADRGKLFDSEAGPLKPDAGLYAYLPDQGYDGKDSATILVDFGGGLKVQVKYYFQAVSTGIADNWVETYCSKTGPYWKISSPSTPAATTRVRRNG